MRYIKKWYILLLIVFLSQVLFESCSRHYRYKRMIKRRRSAVSKRYITPYQKKIKRNTIPINKNYIIKNKRNTRGVPSAARRK